MAQLIKLYDYISRYELDTYRYPSQFIRLKKQQWQKVYTAWEGNTFVSVMKKTDEREEPELEQESFLGRIKNKFSKSKDEVESTEIKPLLIEQATEDEQFQIEFTIVPKSLEELKYLFLDHIFKFQLRWASSTIRDKSFVDKTIHRDVNLKYFLQRLPEHFLFLYHPVFQLKNAPVELDIIMVGPSEIYCMTLLENNNEAVYTGSKERFWTEIHGNQEKKVLNPLISLNRTSSVVQQLITTNKLDIPVKKVVVSRNGYIDFPFAPFDIDLLDKRAYEDWFQRMRRSSSPLKHVQLKAAYVLLSHCSSNSYKRTEWNDLTN